MRTCCDTTGVGGDERCDPSARFKQVIHPHLCPGTMKKATYLPMDVEKVRVEVLKYPEHTCDAVAPESNPTLVSQFYLGNSGSSEMSASLDNIDPGCYSVTAALSHPYDANQAADAGVGDFIQGVSGEDLVLFIGSARVEIKGDGTSSLARIILVGQAPSFYVPGHSNQRQPAFIVSISQEGGVLKEGDMAKFDIKVINPNDPDTLRYETPFSNTRVHIQVEHFGVFSDEENPLPVIDLRDGNLVPVGSDPANKEFDGSAFRELQRGAERFPHREDHYSDTYRCDPGDETAGLSNDVRLQVELHSYGAKKSSSHQVSFQPFACRAYHDGGNNIDDDFCGPETSTSWLLGRKEKFTVTIAPVGDLDLSLVVLSRLQCIADDSFLGSDVSTTDGFGCIKAFQSGLNIPIGNNDGMLGPGNLYDAVAPFNFLARAENCEIDQTVQDLYSSDKTVNFPRTLLEDSRSTFDLFFRAQKATRPRIATVKLAGSCPGLARAAIVEVGWSAEAPYLVTDENSNAKLVQSGPTSNNADPTAFFNPYTIEAISDGVKFTILEDDPQAVFSGDFLYFRVRVAARAEFSSSTQHRGLCSYELQSEVEMAQEPSGNPSMKSGTTSQNLNFQAVGSSFFCSGGHELGAFIQGIKHKTCPVIKNIQWGSTSSFDAKCTTGESHKIRLCVFKTKLQNVGGDEQLDPAPSDHPRVRLYSTYWQNDDVIYNHGQEIHAGDWKELSPGPSGAEVAGGGVTDVCPRLFLNAETQNNDGHDYQIARAWEVTYEWTPKGDRICQKNHEYSTSVQRGQKLYFKVLDESREAALIPEGSYSTDDLSCTERIVSNSAPAENDFEQLMCAYLKDAEGTCLEPKCYNKCDAAFTSTRNRLSYDKSSAQSRKNSYASSSQSYYSMSQRSETYESTGVDVSHWSSDQWRKLATSGDKLIVRECSRCVSSHKYIVYKRLTDWGTIDIRHMMYHDWFSKPTGGRNLLNLDFKLYSSIADAENDRNAWMHCNYDDKGVGFPRDCGQNSQVGGQWTGRGNYDKWSIVGKNTAQLQSWLQQSHHYNALANNEQTKINAIEVELQENVENVIACHNTCPDIPRSRRSILQSQSAPGCSESPYGCLASDQVPFEIKVEDGRLTVSMDPNDFVGKSVEVASAPKGLVPKRTRFIASDFTEKLTGPSSSWSATLRTKVRSITQSDILSKNLVPGISAADLVVCCYLDQTEAAEVISFMNEIVVSEKTSFYTVQLLDQAKAEENKQQELQNKQGTTSWGSTTTSTTTTSTSTSSSSESLLVVIAVAAILVLVAVIALVVVTNKSRSAERVAEVKRSRETSWVKSSALDLDL